MTVEEIQNLIKKAIFSGRQIVMNYTNAQSKIDSYKILSITSTWAEYFKTKAVRLSDCQSRFRKASR